MNTTTFYKIKDIQDYEANNTITVIVKYSTHLEEIVSLANRLWTSLSSGHLGVKRGAQNGGYENLWFSRLNLDETVSKHSLLVNSIVFVA